MAFQVGDEIVLNEAGRKWAGDKKWHETIFTVQKIGTVSTITSSSPLATFTIVGNGSLERNFEETYNGVSNLIWE